MSKRESSVMREVAFCLNHYGFYVVGPDERGFPLIETKNYCGIAWRSNTGAVSIGKRFVRFGIAGLPDYTGWVFDGRRLAIEVKAPKKLMTQDQRRHLLLAVATGNVAFKADSYASCEEGFKRYGLSRKTI